MAFVLDADPASATMNCYVTVAEADDYFEARFDPLDEGEDGNSAWLGFSDTKKTALLVSASRDLDNFTYGGLPVENVQPMKWPRKNVYMHDSLAVYPTDELPAKIT